MGGMGGQTAGLQLLAAEMLALSMVIPGLGQAEIEAGIAAGIASGFDNMPVQARS